MALENGDSWRAAARVTFGPGPGFVPVYARGAGFSGAPVPGVLPPSTAFVNLTLSEPLDEAEALILISPVEPLTGPIVATTFLKYARPDDNTITVFTQDTSSGLPLPLPFSIGVWRIPGL